MQGRWGYFEVRGSVSEKMRKRGGERGGGEWERGEVGSGKEGRGERERGERGKGEGGRETQILPSALCGSSSVAFIFLIYRINIQSVTFLKQDFVPCPSGYRWGVGSSFLGLQVYKSEERS